MSSRLMIARFESEAALREWRDHPEHLEAQRAGRERYRIEICNLDRSFEHP